MHEAHFAEGLHEVKRVCSWCDKDMGTSTWLSPKTNIITHTICIECFDLQIAANIGAFVERSKRRVEDLEDGRDWT